MIWFVAVAMMQILITSGHDNADTGDYLEELWSAYPSGQLIKWPSAKVLYNYEKSGMYHPINILPTRFQMIGDTVFILTPRYRKGVPSTLNKFQLSCSKFMVRLEPWPSLEANSVMEADGIINAIDLVLDDDGILWLLDIGEANTLGPPEHDFFPLPKVQAEVTPAKEPPRIFGFDINNSSLVARYELWGLITNDSKLQFIQVEIVEDNKFIYVSDAGTRSILMFEESTGRGYKILLPPVLGGGKTDVMYMALVTDPAILLLTFLSSSRIFALPTGRLRSGRLGDLSLLGTKPGPIVILGIDNDHRMFFRMRGEGDIHFWNINEKFIKSNFHLVRESKYRRGTHVTSGHLSLVWLLESNFHDFVHGIAGCLGPSAKLLPLINQTSNFPTALN